MHVRSCFGTLDNTCQATHESKFLSYHERKAQALLKGLVSAPRFDVSLHSLHISALWPWCPSSLSVLPSFSHSPSLPRVFFWIVFVSSQERHQVRLGTSHLYCAPKVRKFRHGGFVNMALIALEAAML
eukprot:2253434-Amphidinium_carterae.1